MSPKIKIKMSIHYIEVSMKKKIAVLGITGSIGESTVEIVRHHSDRFEIVFASAHSDAKKLVEIAEELHINRAVLTGAVSKENTTECPVKIYYGASELLRLIANEDYDILINAVTGSAGLPFTIATLERGKTLALANKESLVMAGHIVKELLAKKGGSIVPIDSEHSAIFQVLNTQNQRQVKYLHITASGGAFRKLPLSKFEKIDVKQALKHPTWTMGTKVTIDSATMMNKGLELIEAHWLFDLPYSQLKAVIHPQSVIHSIVEFVDGSMIAQMSVPTMQLPILYALTHPDHIASDKVQTSLTELTALTFEQIDPQRYPLFFIACKAGKDGGIMPTILNAANEKAIEMFLKSQISFPEIATFVEKTLNKYENIQKPDINTIIEINQRILS